VAWLREWVIRLWGTLRPRRRDADLEEELRVHLELAAEHEAHHVRSAAEARRTAAIRSGGIAQTMDALRDQRGLPWLGDLTRDLQYGVRVLRRNPMFALVAVLTLALGIGANTAIFSLADPVLFRTLPVSSPRDLVILFQRGPAGNIFPFTTGAATDLAADRQVLSGLAAFRPIPSTHVNVNGEAELALAQFVSGNYHAVLGVHAALGRTLTEHDREPVAVLSHRYWLRRFAGDANIIGRTFEMQGRSFTVVGVTPPEFFGTQPGRYIDVTAPLIARTNTMPPRARWLYLIGRLAPGVSLEQARAALHVRWSQITSGTSAQSSPVSLELAAGAQGLNELRRQFSLPLRILLAAVSVVLLVACANLAGLLIARASGREREIAVRVSLGAGHGRIVRQLIAESALLAAAGGVAGVALANVTTDALLAMLSRGRTPIAIDVALNSRTLLYAGVVTIVTTAVFGLLPALLASRRDVQPYLKSSISGADRMRLAWGRAMVAAQVALLVLLLTTAGLFTRTLQKLRSVDPGFRQEQVLVLRVSTDPTYRGPRKQALYEELHARFSALPAVQSVSRSMDTPLGGEMSMSAGIAVPGHPADPEDAPPVYHNFVGPRFFETMGISVLAGRDFGPEDDERAPQCVIISEGVAQHYFRGEDALGRQILVRRTPASIVGIVKDVKFTSLRADAPLVIYRPYLQEPGALAETFLIRTSAAPAGITALLHAEIRATAQGLPLPSIVSLDDQVAGALVEERMLAALSSAIGVLASILAVIGIYSTVASAVARRQREIGIRVALGALPGGVTRMVVGETFRTLAAGFAIGIPLALAAGRAARDLLTSVLFELSPMDPFVLSGSCLAILTVASLAAYVPARRAARIDPVSAIKYE
jgi:predicted permease